MKYVFVDTNFLIHYRSIEEIDWANFFKEEKLSFQISQTVVEELDNHKYSEKNFLQKRSRKILSRLQKIEDWNSNLPKNLNVNICTLQISDEIYRKKNLNKSRPDDRIIASLLEYHSQNKENKPVLVTGDFSMSIKAKTFDIETVILNEEFQVPSSESDEIKEIRRLKHENERLKNLFPDVDLAFQNKKNFSKQFIHKPLKVRENYIDNKIKDLKKNYPKVEIRRNNERTVTVNDLAKLKLPSFNQKPPKIYNEELDEFYAEYRSYLKQRIYYLAMLRRSFELVITVCNEGTSPAEDIDIRLHFPDGFEVFDSQELPFKNPKKIKPPSKEYSNSILGGLGAPLYSRMYDMPHLHTPSNVGGLNIKKTNSYEVKSYINKIKHNQCEILDSIIVLFHPDEEVKGFTIDYRIDIGNYPDPIEGKLNVSVEEI